MLAALINFFVHPALADDADRLLRVRILIAVLLTLVAQETTVLIVLLLRFPPAAILFGGSLTLLSVATSLFLLVRLRAIGNYFFCGIAAPLITFSLIIAGICVSGGLAESPVTQMMVAPVLMAYFFGGIRWGSYTVGLALLTGALLMVLQAGGVDFPQTIDSPVQMRSTHLLISMINFTFICGLAIAYEYTAQGLRRERDAEHAKSMRLARLDPLTGLANRRNFDAALQQRVAAASAHGFVLGYLDLDGFKPINDRYGHAVGDEVLTIVADRLRSTLRGSETVGRYGGDEFIVILEAQSKAANLDLLAQRLLAAIGEPISTSKGLVNVGCSVGLALSPAHGSDMDALKQAADAAMYEAKRTRSGWCIYRPGL